ncbi:alpha/beta fold hydrolase, partial [Enterococcus sp. 3H8_DIV0648]|uniref:alpha/beta fold hydrolase n=2 Tax=Enterococcus TaxID=1350 RepID=UPI000B64B2F3
MMFIILILCILLLGILTIIVKSPGRLSPLRDEKGRDIPNAISEKIWIDVNGTKQGMFIRGEKPNNPILLYLHGGPGTPMLQFIDYMEKSERLEKDYTVCYWDQRGSGMSYNRATEPSELTIDQMIEDTFVVTEYLRVRFKQKKILLLGHSWGSYLGIKTIEKYPHSYWAYVGVGQVTDQRESERLAYKYMMQRAEEENDSDVIARLSKFNPDAKDFPQLDYLVKGRTKILNKYGIGHLHQGLK